MRWCAVATLLLVSAIDCSAATSSDTGRVQAADETQSTTTVKPGRNGYGTVAYSSETSDSSDSSDSSETSDSSDSSEAAANRLALEQAEALHPNLRLRLGIGI